MPFYYNPDSGDLDFTDDADLARKGNLLTLLGSSSYPLAPETAGQLHKALGPAPIDMGREDAMQHVRRVLRGLGLGHLPMDAATEFLPEGWRVIIRVA